MRTHHKPKGLKRAEFLKVPLLHGPCTRATQRLVVHTCLAVTGLVATLAWAETIYRCGEAYSTSNQCGNTAATEVKPSSVLHASGPHPSHTAANDVREAQALEKQRMQAERQAGASAPIKLSTPLPPTPNPTQPTSSQEPRANHTPHQGKHNRQRQSPYFTAVDPNATPKKKSTAKAVPAAASKP